MQTGSSLRKIGRAAGALLLLVCVAACSSDDGESTGATGGSPGSASPTATSTPPNTPDAGSPGTVTGSPGGSQTPFPPSDVPLSDEPPASTATANGVSVETGIGTYCWTRMCVDKIGVPTKGTLTVSRGDIVTIAVPPGIPTLREAAANTWQAVGAQQLDDGSTIWPYPGSPGEPIAHGIAGNAVTVTVDLAPGTYVLAVSLYFEPVGTFFNGGDVVYGVLLEVE